jgi:hypothetical protein
MTLDRFLLKITPNLSYLNIIKKMTIQKLLLATLFWGIFSQPSTLSAQEKADVKVEKLDNKDFKAVAKNKDKADNEFMSRLVVGARVNLGFGANAYGSAFNIGIHPMAAYRLTDFLRGGPSLGYSHLAYSNSANSAGNYSINVFGGGIFLDVRPLPMEELGFISNFYIKGEIGYYGASVNDGNGNNINNFIKSAYNVETSKAMIGAGYSSNFGRGASYQLEYLYNAFWTTRDVLINPYAFEVRAAVMYGF